MSRSKTSRLATIIGVLGLGWVTAHFTATTLHLAAGSLVGLSFGGLTASYMNPLFSQKWALFAPDPPLQNRSFHYQCADSSGIETTWMGSLKNLTEQHQRHRITPSSYLRRIETGAMRSAVGGVQSEYLQKFIQKAAGQAEGQEDEVVLATIAELATQNTIAVTKERRVAYRVGLHHCQELVGEPNSIRIRSTWSDIPKFSQRNDDKSPVVHAFTLPWATPAEVATMVDQIKDIRVTVEDAREMVRQARAAREDGAEAESAPTPTPASTPEAPGDEGRLAMSQ